MHRVRFSLSLLLILLVLQTAEAQKGRTRSRNLGIGTLAGNPLVHQELKLSDEQKATLKKVVTATRTAAKAAQALEEPERARKNREATRKLRAAISATCNDKQQKRLLQIEIQYTSGSWMLMRPELSSILKLTNQQRRQIREVSKTSQEKVHKFRESRNDDNLREVQLNINAQLAQARKDAVKLLTEEQRTSWKAASGVAFELWPAKKKKNTKKKAS
jgi:hypothetical protein